MVGKTISIFIIFILKSIGLVHKSVISARIAHLAVRFVLKSDLSTNHIRVLTSANQSYLIIGFKQPINFKKNVIWQMSKNKKSHEWFKSKHFFADKNKQIWIATVNYQRISNFTNSNRQIKNIILCQIWSKRQQKQNESVRENKGKFTYCISNFTHKTLPKLFQITCKTYNIFKLACVVSYSL
jgi:ligand-binding sensor domain-containing protein